MRQRKDCHLVVKLRWSCWHYWFYVVERFYIRDGENSRKIKIIQKRTKTSMILIMSHIRSVSYVRSIKKLNSHSNRPPTVRAGQKWPGKLISCTLDMQYWIQYSRIILKIIQTSLRLTKQVNFRSISGVRNFENFISGCYLLRCRI